MAQEAAQRKTSIAATWVGDDWVGSSNYLDETGTSLTESQRDQGSIGVRAVPLPSNFD